MSIVYSSTRRTLTEREQQVAALLAQGLCDKAIARELGLSYGTVKSHVRGVLRVLNVVNRTQAAIRLAAQ